MSLVDIVPGGLEAFFAELESSALEMLNYTTISMKTIQNYKGSDEDKKAVAEMNEDIINRLESLKFFAKNLKVMQNTCRNVRRFYEGIQIISQQNTNISPASEIRIKDVTDFENACRALNEFISSNKPPGEVEAVAADLLKYFEIAKEMHSLCVEAQKNIDECHRLHKIKMDAMRAQREQCKEYLSADDLPPEQEVIRNRIRAAKSYDEYDQIIEEEMTKNLENFTAWLWNVRVPRAEEETLEYATSIEDQQAEILIECVVWLQDLHEAGAREKVMEKFEKSPQSELRLQVMFFKMSKLEEAATAGWTVIRKGLIEQHVGFFEKVDKLIERNIAQFEQVRHKLCILYDPWSSFVHEKSTLNCPENAEKRFNFYAKFLTIYSQIRANCEVSSGTILECKTDLEELIASYSKMSTTLGRILAQPSEKTDDWETLQQCLQRIFKQPTLKEKPEPSPIIENVEGLDLDTIMRKCLEESDKYEPLRKKVKTITEEYIDLREEIREYSEDVSLKLGELHEKLQPEDLEALNQYNTSQSDTEREIAMERLQKLPIAHLKHMLIVNGLSEELFQEHVGRVSELKATQQEREEKSKQRMFKKYLKVMDKVVMANAAYLKVLERL